jgi:NADPH2:quinone reductase
VQLAAVQLAALVGASVTAVASSAAKLAVAKSYGADVVINHKEAGLRQALRDAFADGVDVVVDPVGGDLAEPTLRALLAGRSRTSAPRLRSTRRQRRCGTSPTARPSAR